MATFKVLEWQKPKGLETADPMLDMPFDCECGQEAFIPRVGREPMIIFIKGMGYIYEPGCKPPEGTFPQKVQCRKCRKSYQLS
jgi:hypothetical protein